jgi:hypothetical protein
VKFLLHIFKNSFQLQLKTALTHQTLVQIFPSQSFAARNNGLSSGLKHESLVPPLVGQGELLV